MTPFIALWTSLAVGLGAPGHDLPAAPLPGSLGDISGGVVAENADPRALRELQVLPGSDLEGRLVEVVFALDGAVQVRDFTMEGPDRLVVDLVGARTTLAEDRFQGLGLGGITAIRARQYSPDIVRVELELAAPAGYAITSGDGFVRVSLENLFGEFEPWAAPAAAGANGSMNGSAPAASGTVARAAAPQPRGAWGGIAAQDTSRRMSVTFVDTPIREVLFTFAEVSQRSIVPGSGVTGAVTAEIRDQPWDIALQTILEAHGLAAQEQASGIIRVDRLQDIQTRVEVEPTQTRVFRINFAPAGEVEPAVQSLLSTRGNISASRGTNTLVVTDVPQVLDQVASLIEGLDVETPGITISAKIIFVNRTDLEETGIVYELKDSRGNQINRTFPGALDEDGDGMISQDERVPIGTNVISFGGNSIAAIGNANQRVSAPAAQFLTSLIIGRHTLLSFVEALQSANLSDIQAHPQVTVLENQTANILVGERVPIPVTQQTGVSGGAQDGQALFQPFTVQFQEVGIRLEVTPQVAAGNLILMDVEAERSGVEVVESFLGFIFNTQEARTRVLVQDGETVVIGGLTVTETAELRSGIPLLMNLPVVGRLFRLSREEKSQRDLIIMITPQINRR
jgi:type IV pilus assembly protein PilQ